jgi:hypothetical protein
MHTLNLLSLNCNFFPPRCNYTPQKFVMLHRFLSSSTLKMKELLSFEISTVTVRRHSVLSHTTWISEFWRIYCNSLWMSWLHTGAFLAAAVTAAVTNCSAYRHWWAICSFNVSEVDICHIATDDR